MTSHTRVEAIDLNPLNWLGDAASSAVGDVWQAAMTGLWSAALWLLQLAFKIIDAFTTPDVSAHGPMGAVLPTTLWIGATLAVIMMFVQLTMALLRRDGQSLGRVLIGIGQFGLVWVGCLGVAAGFVAAASGLERGILRQMLNVDSLSSVPLTANFPTSIADVTLATVLGVLSLLVVIPAAFFYVLIMVVREAALIILVATAPISAGGLISDVGKVWFFKTLRWFFSCLLISPMAALLLGIGVKISAGIITGTPPTAAQLAACHALSGAAQTACLAGLSDSASTAAQAGMAVVGCIIIAIGACCPLILFRLLAFVEPGTASGASLRQSWSDAGGMSGVVSGGRQSSGSSAATQSSSDGRSGGESGAESQTQSRLSSALGAFGTGMQVATSIAHKAADIGSDILGQAGIGSPGYSMTPTDERSTRRTGGSTGGSSGSGGDGATSGSDGRGLDGGASGGGGPGGGPLPEPPSLPVPGGGGAPGAVPVGGVPSGAGAGGAGGGEAAAAVVAP